jgi:tRNA(Ile)-lysidine synthase
MPIRPLESRLALSWPPEEWKDLTVLAAVSGGSDSVALLRGLAAIRLPGEGRLITAHVNHKLRGADSDADEDFVRQLCQQLGLECEVATFAVRPAAESRQGIEGAARKARYSALEELAGRAGARFIVTAHTADDQAETILHRIIRGTGIRGLGGMSRSRRLGPATLLRPLLTIAHAELVAYLCDCHQPFRTDASNHDVRFMRNRIRRELLPLLNTHYNPNMVAALLRLGELAGETQRLIDGIVHDLVERSLRCIQPDVVRLDIEVLAKKSPHLVREALVEVWRRQGWPMMAMGFAEWKSLAAMIVADAMRSTGESSKRMFPGAITAEVRQGQLILASHSA